MPYIFGALVAANVALFGYYWLMPSEPHEGTAAVVKSQLQKPMAYQNSSQALPPLLGEK